jgi:hypothetical protein
MPLPPFPGGYITVERTGRMLAGARGRACRIGKRQHPRRHLSSK